LFNSFFPSPTQNFPFFNLWPSLVPRLTSAPQIGRVSRRQYCALYKFTYLLTYLLTYTVVGQASSPNAEAAGPAAELIADIGWRIASSSSSPSSPVTSSVTSSSCARDVMLLPLSVASLSARAQDLHRRVRNFLEEQVLPAEPDVLSWASDPQTKWTTHPRLEHLKVCSSRCSSSRTTTTTTTRTTRLTSGTGSS